MPNETVVLTGVKETLAALKEFDKDAVKRFNKVINTELSNAEREARSLVEDAPPMSGWRRVDATNPKKITRGGAGWPGWDSGRIRTGIKKTKAQGKVRRDYTTSAGALLNQSAEGAIFEVAGRKTKAGFARTSSSQFLRTLSARFGAASRTVWRTVDKDAPRIQNNVERAFLEAKAELDKHLNRERG